MHRRLVLRVLAAAAAAAGLSPEQLRALAAPGSRRRAAAVLFTPHQRAIVDAIADTILPRTDTPGAADAGVTDFIELVVGELFDPPERGRFLRGLADVDGRARAAGAGSFVDADAASRVAVLRDLEAGGARDREPFFHRVRGLVLHGYYTSEVGMTEELRWQVIPGRYDGCVDVATVTRSGPGGD